MRCTPSTTTTRGLSNNGTVSGDSELKTAGLLAAIRICSLVAAKMAMVVITESERVVCKVAGRRSSTTETYKTRNTVERAINRLHGYRAVATRYDKREFVYKGTIDVASIGIWLRQPADQDPRDTP